VFMHTARVKRVYCYTWYCTRGIAPTAWIQMARQKQNVDFVPKMLKRSFPVFNAWRRGYRPLLLSKGHKTKTAQEVGVTFFNLLRCTKLLVHYCKIQHLLTSGGMEHNPQ
jgi:hypothetical protein